MALSFKKRSEKSQRQGRPINLKVEEIAAVLSLGTGVVGEINKALKASGWVSITPTIRTIFPRTWPRCGRRPGRGIDYVFVHRLSPPPGMWKHYFNPTDFMIGQCHYNQSTRSTIPATSPWFQKIIREPWKRKGAVPYMIKSTNQILSSTSAVSGIILPHLHPGVWSMWLHVCVDFLYFSQLNSTYSWSSTSFCKLAS